MAESKQQQNGHRFANWMTARWYQKLQDCLANGDQINGAADSDSLQEKIDSAIVVQPEDVMPGRVQFGSLVTVFSTTEEEEQSFQIVSHDEAQTFSEGNLSCEAPLAQVLMGKIEGQLVQIMLSNGAECEYEVTHIRTPPPAS